MRDCGVGFVLGSGLETVGGEKSGREGEEREEETHRARLPGAARRWQINPRFPLVRGARGG